MRLFIDYKTFQPYLPVRINAAAHHVQIYCYIICLKVRLCICYFQFIKHAPSLCRTHLLLST